MPFKDHPVFVSIFFCAATAASTYAVMQKVEVQPLITKIMLLESAEVQRTVALKKAEEEKAIQTQSSPKISNIVSSEITSKEGQSWTQKISFKDPEGDAAFINFMVLSTNNSKITTTSSGILTASDIQKAGATLIGTWHCKKENYSVDFRVIITDRQRNESIGHEYSIVCNGG